MYFRRKGRHKKKDIAELLHITDEAANRMLPGFMKRGIVACKADRDGERGYMYGEAMAEVYAIFAACKGMGEHVK